jgi:FkbM family methyltransferase
MFVFEETVAPPMMHVIDIGAMHLGGHDPYARLSERGLLTVTGFEPQPAECEKLNRLGVRGRKYLPYAIGNGERERKFYVTNTGMTSSLFEPDLELANRFRGLAEFLQVVSVQNIDTVKLDEVAELRGSRCDLLKLDTQGSEVEILSHAGRTLAECVVVQTEVEFVPLYRGQPLFAEVDQLLRQHGFMFHRFSDISGRTFKPLMMNNDPYATLSQQLWSDAIYVPDLRRLTGLEPASLLKLAALLHEIYGSFDLCHVALSAHDTQCGTSYAQRYVSLLRGEQQAAAASTGSPS